MSDLIHVSFSELDAFWQCPVKHRLAYKERWNTDVGRAPLDRGTVWHAMLQTYSELERQKMPVPERKAIVMRVMVSGELGDEENELLEWMYDGYVELYGRDPEHDILATEINRTIPLPDPNDPTRPGKYALKVKIDSVTRNRRTGQIWAWDHKTASDFTPLNRLEWRPQFPLYTWALRAAKLNVWGFLVNSARTKRNKGPMTMEQRFRRNYLVYSDTVLLSHAVNASRTAEAMHSPERVEYASPRDLAMGACTFCDYEPAHRRVMAGQSFDVVLPEFGFRKGFDRPEPVLPKLS